MRLRARVRHLEAKVDVAEAAEFVFAITEERWFELQRSMLRFYDMGPEICPVECEQFEQILADNQIDEQAFRRHIAEQTRSSSRTRPTAGTGRR